MMVDIAVPVMMVCLMTTTLEVDDAAHSTVATQTVKDCAVCNTKGCPEPPWMEKAERLAAIINKAELAKVKPKKPMKDARR